MATPRALGATCRRYLTRADVARLFEVSPGTIARWARAGKLPFVLTLGGQRRYVQEQIVNLMRRSGETRQDVPGPSDATNELPDPARRSP